MAIDRKPIKERLREQEIGTPTWGYGDSGTRFHVTRRASSPRNLEERLEDAAAVNRFTGVCPTVDLHTAWDRSDDWGKVRRYAADLGLRVGAINPLRGEMGLDPDPLAALRKSGYMEKITLARNS